MDPPARCDGATAKEMAGFWEWTLGQLDGWIGRDMLGEVREDPVRAVQALIHTEDLEILAVLISETIEIATLAALQL